MRHHKSIRKFGRVRKVRNALVRSLARSLVIHGKITTTEAKAKEIRPFVEKIISKGKLNTIAARRAVVVQVGPSGAKKVFDTIAPKYSSRKGGYTRITKMPNRTNDAARMAVIEFV